MTDDIAAPATGKRWPIIPTIIVAAAIATMIALGVWQLGRAEEKKALRATYAANLSQPAMAYPRIDPTDTRLLYRTMSANCLSVISWRTLAGRDSSGRSGWRHIAECRSGAEAPGVLVDVGTGQAVSTSVNWAGGPVRGIAITEPDQYSMIERLFGVIPAPRLMIVAETPAPGLNPTARPNPAEMTDNHLSYAIQWFLFAFAAAVIYYLALSRRRSSE